MNQQSHATGGSRLLTIEAILAEHERLLAAQAEREDVDQIRSFVAKLEGSGVYFDEAFERKALQGTLDYWTSELAKHLADQDSSGQKRRSIRNFDAEALRALQGDFTNPFGGIADRMVSLDPGDRHSPAAILRLIDETAQPQNLRFQDGLLKEMISQVAGDSERGSAMQAARERDDASLLEFCLWHLFEDLETRLGNKLYRPRKSGHKLERVDFFSCKVYLVRKADQLFEAAGRPASMLDALMRMGGGTMRPQRPASFLASIAGKFEGFGRAALASLRSRRLQAPKFELYGEKALDLPQFLQAARLAFNEGGKWRIVHPALARWDPLKERRWKAAQKEKLLFLSFTAVVVALVTSLAWIGWYELWTSLAMSRLAKAQIATDPKERVAESVAGLRAAKLSMASDNSYASQVGNDAIGAPAAVSEPPASGVRADPEPGNGSELSGDSRFCFAGAFCGCLPSVRRESGRDASGGSLGESWQGQAESVRDPGRLPARQR